MSPAVCAFSDMAAKFKPQSRTAHTPPRGGEAEGEPRVGEISPCTPYLRPIFKCRYGVRGYEVDSSISGPGHDWRAMVVGCSVPGLGELGPARTGYLDANRTRSEYLQGNFCTFFTVYSGYRGSRPRDAAHRDIELSCRPRRHCRLTPFRHGRGSTMWLLPASSYSMSMAKAVASWSTRSPNSVATLKQHCSKSPVT